MSKMYALGAVALSVLAGTAMGQVSATAVALEGDVIDGSVVTGLSAPAVNGVGQVGYLATLDDARRAFVIDGALVFETNQALPDVVAGGESTIGIGDNGEFIYSPSFNGGDAVWGEFGLRAVDDTPAPGFASNVNSTFHSRPRMTDSGMAYWVSGFNDGAGGTSTQGRMIYTQTGNGAINLVVKAGDVVDGATVGAFGGIDFDLEFSGNNQNVIWSFNDADAGTATDGSMVVNGSIVAREGSATNQGDNWDNFNDVSINNAGNYLFSGDTDGATTSDAFIAYNGAIAVREGMTVDNLTLTTSPGGVAINDNNEAAFVWGADDGTGAAETLFYAAAAADLGSALALVSVGDTIDLGADGLWLLDDINAFNTGDIAFGENGLITLNVDLESLDGLASIEAVVSFVVPTPGAGAVLAVGGLVAMRRRR